MTGVQQLSPDIDMPDSPNIRQQLAGNLTLSDKNADPDNWKWKAESSGWKPAEQNWRDFCAKWYGATEIKSASLLYPKSLSLEPLPVGLDVSSAIFIRDSYVTMFDTIWEKAMAQRGRSGVIISGQPGVGKTLFNYYLLVRLLQRKQVILFSPDGEIAYLFYHKEVYSTSTKALAGQSLDVSLPKPISSSDAFIWSLFDIYEEKEPAFFLVSRRCFPVQTALLDAVRYRTWEKERLPMLTGLPLWTHNELAQGYTENPRAGCFSRAHKQCQPLTGETGN